MPEAGDGVTARGPRQRTAVMLGCGGLHVCVEQSANELGMHISLHGEWDIGTAGEVHAALAAVRSRGPTNLVVDLRGLVFIDVTSLVVLLQLDAEGHRHGGTLTLIRRNAEVHRLFELAAVSERLRLVDAPQTEPLPYRGEAGGPPVQMRLRFEKRRSSASRNFWRDWRPQLGYLVVVAGFYRKLQRVSVLAPWTR